LPKTFLLLVLAVGILLFAREYYQAHRLRSKKKASESKQFPFMRKPALFSTAERGLWRELNQAIGKENIVFAKVRLADVVRLRPDLKGSEANTTRDEIASTSLDFVICRRSNLAIAAGIKLTDSDDSSGSGADEVAYAEGALSAAGVPLVRLAAEEEYTAAMLSTELQRARNALAAAKMKPKGDRGNPSSPSGLAVVSTSKSEACPTCGAHLVKRRVSGGRMDGNYVLACPHYPSCRHIMPLSVQTAAAG
jgi:hypothetical protein